MCRPDSWGKIRGSRGCRRWRCRSGGVDPALLAGGAAGTGVLEGVADRETGEHLLLNAKEDPTEIDSCVVAVAADHSIPALRIAHGSGRFGVLTPRLGAWQE